MADNDQPLPLILPLGDQGILVRFGTTLSDAANQAAIAFARRLHGRLPEGVTEIDPNLVSVLLRYDPERIDFERLAGELRLRLSAPEDVSDTLPATHRIIVRFGGSEGPDLVEAAAALGMTAETFIAAHNASPLRVLTTGFAPGFVYCGFHPEAMRLPRRANVRPPVPVGSVLFAAGQTAITSTSVPTGWHVIGRTDFRNFDPDREPPTLLVEGDLILFEAVCP
ncbi:MAG TPA: allophanate hydrolase subunit 1 [Devosiaceae bacterium]|nr:allophanate hydrolase subunit 1 [Devosiaceae bacterium]